MRVPTIDPANKAKIKTKRDWLLTQLGETVPENEAGAMKSTPSEKEASGLRPQTSGLQPQPETPAPPATPDPRIEAHYPGAGTAASEEPAADSSSPPHAEPKADAQPSVGEQQ